MNELDSSLDALRDAYVLEDCAMCGAAATHRAMPESLTALRGFPGFPVCGACAATLAAITNQQELARLYILIAAACALREDLFWAERGITGYEH